ncbi:MAG: hypothetical protein A2176_14800 [Spirochaetes bacterium RBG_13_51_14]|nr:MAG: hypothetical protein A2176_14800 [Spirochaetes bacterium RBG_13_51_14]
MRRFINHIQFASLIMVAIAATGCDERNKRLELLVGHNSLREFISIESDSVTMYATPADKRAGIIECRIFKDEYDIFIKVFRVLGDREIRNTYQSKGGSRFTADFIKSIRSADEKRFNPGTDPARPLAGLRVAIDPGHSAGSMEEAVREGKYIRLFAPDGSQLSFYEAQLNLATARCLKEMLEMDGASVMLTRETNRQVYPVSFNRWVRRDFPGAVREKLRNKYISREAAEWLLRRSGDRARLKFFNSEFEMPYRAKIINSFRPHVTALVHYDARDSETAYRNKYVRIKAIMEKNGPCCDQMEDVRDVVESITEIDKNFCSVFVPGCFLPGELDTIESRIEFLRLVVSPDLDDSIRYSTYVIKNFQKYLDVPTSDRPFPGSIRVGLCREGIYARNLRMTRLVRGALCLGEPLQQNYREEASRLAAISDGIIPERVKAVARAYYDAIREYVRDRLTN